MPVYKDKTTGKWYVMAWYITLDGQRKQKCKKGFFTKREALVWEREFQYSDTCNINMLFSTFMGEYLDEMRPRLKRNTFITKENIINNHILPYLGNRKLSEITPKDIREWQNKLLESGD